MNLFKKTLFFIILIYFPILVFSQTPIKVTVDKSRNFIISEGQYAVAELRVNTFPENLPVNYIWTLISKPEDSKLNFRFENSRSTFFIPDKPGTYIVRVYILINGLIEHEDTTIIVTAEKKPIAITGEDELVRPGSLVNLSAEGSFHFESEENLHYRWNLEKIPEGSSAQIYSPDEKQTSFHADVEGFYLARLVVFSSTRQTSLPSYKVIRVEGTRINAPIADAGDNTIVGIEQDSTLMGNVSYTGKETLTYKWKIESAPIESSAELKNSESLTPIFRTDTTGTYILSFQAIAGNIIGAPDLIEVTARKQPVALVVNTNIIALTNQTVSLNGLSSFDPAGLDLTYSWTVVKKPNTSTVNISDTTAPQTNFSANKEGEYILELRVNSLPLSSDPKQVHIRLISPSSFKAEAGNNQVITAGSSLSLSASSSLGNDLEYFWSLIDKPDLSYSDLLENNFSDTKIDIDKAGAYIFRLQIIQEGFLSSPDYVVFNAILPTGINVFDETFSPDEENLTLPISECEEIIKTITVSNPQNKEYVILFENKGVEEFFAILNGKALTGKLEPKSDVFVYPVSLNENNTLSIRVRGTKTDSLGVRVIEKPPSQSLPTPPTLTAKSISVSLGSSGTVFVGGNRLTYSVLEEPRFGTAEVNTSGLLTYTSNGETSGKDFILVKVVDVNNLASVVPIEITIN